MCVDGTEPASSARAVNAPKRYTISPAKLWFWHMKHNNSVQLVSPND